MVIAQSGVANQRANVHRGPRIPNGCDIRGECRIAEVFRAAKQVHRVGRLAAQRAPVRR